MMDPRTLAIPLAFILLAAVLLLLLIGSKWNWWQKLLLIIVVPTFALAVWSSLGSYKGWPTDSKPPRKALVFWVVVREPEPSGDPGAIYLWLRAFNDKPKTSFNPLDYISHGGEPRAYVLPYTRSRHEGADKARIMIKDGKPVVIDFGRKGRGSGDADGEGDADGDGEGDGDGDGQGEGNADGQGGPGGPGGYGVEPGREDFKVYELPPPAPPRKLPE